MHRSSSGKVNRPIISGSSRSSDVGEHDRPEPVTMYRHGGQSANLVNAPAHALVPAEVFIKKGPSSSVSSQASPTSVMTPESSLLTSPTDDATGTLPRQATSTECSIALGWEKTQLVYMYGEKRRGCVLGDRTYSESLVIFIKELLANDTTGTPSKTLVITNTNAKSKNNENLKPLAEDTSVVILESNECKRMCGGARDTGSAASTCVRTRNSAKRKMDSTGFDAKAFKRVFFLFAPLPPKKDIIWLLDTFRCSVQYIVMCDLRMETTAELQVCLGTEYSDLYSDLLRRTIDISEKCGPGVTPTTHAFPRMEADQLAFKTLLALDGTKASVLASGRAFAPLMGLCNVELVVDDNMDDMKLQMLCRRNFLSPCGQEPMKYLFTFYLAKHVATSPTFKCENENCHQEHQVHSVLRNQQGTLKLVCWECSQTNSVDNDVLVWRPNFRDYQLKDRQHDTMEHHRVYAVMQKIMADVQASMNGSETNGSQPAVHVIVETSDPYSTRDLAKCLNSFMGKLSKSDQVMPKFIGGPNPDNKYIYIGVLAIRLGMDNDFFRASNFIRAEKCGCHLWTLNIRDARVS